MVHIRCHFGVAVGISNGHAIIGTARENIANNTVAGAHTIINKHLMQHGT